MKKRRSKKNIHAALRRQWHKDGTYERLGKEQNWFCICGKSALSYGNTIGEKLSNGKIVRFTIDHDHKTLKPRGILCRGCNLRLRKDHTIEWLRAAANYLENHHETI